MMFPIEDSRRLTGPNFFFDAPGAVLDSAPSIQVDEALIAAWRANIATMRRTLGWPDGSTATRIHRSGASFAFVAPIDQLFTATDVNEWAFLKALPSSTRVDSFHAPGYAAAWDDDTAAYTLRALSTAERNPKLIALLDAARARDVPALLDDEALTLGAGAHSQTSLLDALPSPAGIDWEKLHAIPLALVTGSNGKTTTTRLVAAMFKAQSVRCGLSSTEGVFVGDEMVVSGDYSGPAGARHVLRDARAEAAVLETARGGILRRGLALDRADAAIVTNISSDHFGEYGIDDLDDLADAKLVVARALTANGTLVLNADDAVLVREVQQDKWANELSQRRVKIAWLALDTDHPVLASHRANGGVTCGVRDGHLTLFDGTRDHNLGTIDAMPLTIRGAAKYNIANLAGAALLAHALGIPHSIIAQICARFGASNADNPGRLMRWQFGTTQVLLDYAHNPDGLRGLLEVARTLQPTGRLGIVLGQAGNREDADVRALAEVAAKHQPQRVALKELLMHLRGREAGEIVDLLRDALIRNGVGADEIIVCREEIDAVRDLLAWARDGDLIVLPIHEKTGRAQTVALLNDLAAAHWLPGTLLPT